MLRVGTCHVMAKVVVKKKWSLFIKTKQNKNLALALPRARIQHDGVPLYESAEAAHVG